MIAAAAAQTTTTKTKTIIPVRRTSRRSTKTMIVARAARQQQREQSEEAAVMVDRRRALMGGLATLVAVTQPNAIVLAEESATPKKVVAVPYTPYVVTSESSEEALAVAKALKEAGARLYGAFWCENCNKQKEILGKEAMEIIDYVECFPNGVYQNAEGHEDVVKPDGICEGYTSAWPLWVVPKGEDDEIGIQGQVKKPRELQRLIKEAKGEKVDLVKYFTTLDME